MTHSGSDQETRVALVLGANGAIGSAVAEALIEEGWRVKALVRDPAAAKARASRSGTIEWIAGDAMRESDVVAAAHGARLIFHGVNPPKYRNWRGLALPMMRCSIAAAQASGARLMLLGTVYNYGPDALPLVREGSPQNPLTRKGKVRVEMERLLQAAAGQGVRSLVVRAGDFFGPKAVTSWFTAGILTPQRPLRGMRYPGPHAVGHAWAYVPDLARTVVRLAAIEATLADFEVLNFGGHWLDPGIEIAQAVRRVLAEPRLPIRPFPWLALYGLSPFVTMMREMLEMRYLWHRPLRLDNTKLVTLLGEEPHTPLDEAIEETLRGLGYLSADVAAVADRGLARRSLTVLAALSERGHSGA